MTDCSFKVLRLQVGGDSLPGSELLQTWPLVGGSQLLVVLMGAPKPSHGEARMVRTEYGETKCLQDF